jgi:hypothetical protein
MVQHRPVYLLTDFGGVKSAGDYAVGRMKGAIKKKAPLVEIIDLDHTVPPQKTLAGAWRLLTSIPSLPKDSVVAAIVDPHCGSNRKGVAVELNTGHILVGPADNGLLSASIRAYGLKHAYFIEETKYFNSDEVLFRPKETITGDFFDSVDFITAGKKGLNYETFHGLKVFAPVAAAIALGERLHNIGTEAHEDDIARLVLPLKAERDAIHGCVVDIEAFGTIRTDIPFELLQRIGVKEDDIVRLNISTRNPRGVIPLNLKIARIFSDGSIGSNISLPGSCGGALDCAIVQGDVTEKLRIEHGIDPFSLLDVEKNPDGTLSPVNSVTIQKQPHAVLSILRTSEERQIA